MSTDHEQPIESTSEISGKEQDSFSEVSIAYSGEVDVDESREEPEDSQGTEETIELTPRQLRVLRYLARRRMRNARIVRRYYADEPVTPIPAIIVTPPLKQQIPQTPQPVAAPVMSPASAMAVARNHRPAVSSY